VTGSRAWVRDEEAAKPRAGPRAGRRPQCPGSGIHGPGAPSPEITITRSRFGTTAPAGTSDNTTGYGPCTANGKVYGTNLYFTDDATFEAGFSNSSGADYVGIVEVLEPDKGRPEVRQRLGIFNHWYLTNSDRYALSIKTAIWGGTVTGLS